MNTDRSDTHHPFITDIFNLEEDALNLALRVSNITKSEFNFLTIQEIERMEIDHSAKNILLKIKQKTFTIGSHIFRPIGDPRYLFPPPDDNAPFWK
jgi:hypothetical protein